MGKCRVSGGKREIPAELKKGRKREIEEDRLRGR